MVGTDVGFGLGLKEGPAVIPAVGCALGTVDGLAVGACVIGNVGACVVLVRGSVGAFVGGLVVGFIVFGLAVVGWPLGCPGVSVGPCVLGVSVGRSVVGKVWGAQLDEFG